MGTNSSTAIDPMPTLNLIQDNLPLDDDTSSDGN